VNCPFRTKRPGPPPGKVIVGSEVGLKLSVVAIGRGVPNEGCPVPGWRDRGVWEMFRPMNVPGLTGCCTGGQMAKLV